MSNIKSVYPSAREAKRAIAAWRKQYSNLKGARFTIVPVALGNKVAYEIVQQGRSK